MAFGFLVRIIGLPLFYLIALQKYNKGVRTEEFITLYGDFCEKYRYKRFDRFVLLEPFISVLRMLLLASTCIFLVNYPIFALIALNYQMLLSITYIG